MKQRWLLVGTNLLTLIILVIVFYLWQRTENYPIYENNTEAYNENENLHIKNNNANDYDNNLYYESIINDVQDHEPVDIVQFALDIIRRFSADTPPISLSDMEILEAQDYVVMCFDSELDNQWQVAFRLINNTDFFYGYGGPSALFIRQNSWWVRVPHESHFFSIMWTLPPNDYVKMSIQLDIGYPGQARLLPGEYRIIRTVYKNHNHDEAMPVVGGFTVHEVPGFDIYEPEEVYPPFTLTCCEMAVLKNETRDFRLDFRASESTDRYVVHSLHNNTEHIYLYRYSISLYVQRQNGWDAVPIVDEDYLSFSPPREIQPFDFVVVYLNYYDGMFGRLPPGEYRLVREVRRTLLSDVYPVVGQFTIFE